jgi:hypothetical protein
MAEEMDQIVENLKQPSAWVRVLIMIGFAILLYVIIAPLMFLLMIVQALFTLVTGESNPNLRYLGASVAVYVLQILEFISYNSEIRPFPFTDFPGGEEEADLTEEVAPSAASKRKPAAKKNAASRKAKTGNGKAGPTDKPDADA